jgi:hypothetical protein
MLTRVDIQLQPSLFHIWLATYILDPELQTPLVTVHALGTASSYAVGVSRHPSTRIDPELLAPPSYRPCTWHCLELRRRRFETP